MRSGRVGWRIVDGLMILSVAAVSAISLSASALADGERPDDVNSQAIARYLMLRDKAAVELALLDREDTSAMTEQKSKRHEAEIEKIEETANQSLRRELDRIIGLSKISGFMNHIDINQSELRMDVGFGLVDGLAGETGDHTGRVVWTTKALLRTWIQYYNDGWSAVQSQIPDAPVASASSKLPYELSDLFRSEQFLSLVNPFDAAVVTFGELPISVPSMTSDETDDVVATAELIEYAQDFSGDPPDYIAVSVLLAGRVFLYSEKVKVKIAPSPACKKQWQRDVLKQNDTDESYAQRRFIQCFMKGANGRTYYQSAIKQAEHLIGLTEDTVASLR